MINLLINEGADLVAVNHDDKMPVDVACDGDIRYVIQQKMLEAGKDNVFLNIDCCQYRIHRKYIASLFSKVILMMCASSCETLCPRQCWLI